MDSLARADLFFMISTIGFSLVAILAAIALVYLILVLSRLHRISKRLESDIAHIGDAAAEFFASIRDSRLFSWATTPKKSPRKKKE